MYLIASNIIYTELQKNILARRDLRDFINTKDLKNCMSGLCGGWHTASRPVYQLPADPSVSWVLCHFPLCLVCLCPNGPQLTLVLQGCIWTGPLESPLWFVYEHFGCDPYRILHSVEHLQPRVWFLEARVHPCPVSYIPMAWYKALYIVNKVQNVQNKCTKKYKINSVMLNNYNKSQVIYS